MNNNKHNICNKNNIILSPVHSKNISFQKNKKLSILNNIFTLSNEIYISDEKIDKTDFKLHNSDELEIFFSKSGIIKALIVFCKLDTIALIIILYYIQLAFETNKYQEILETQFELSILNYENTILKKIEQIINTRGKEIYEF